MAVRKKRRKDKRAFRLKLKKETAFSVVQIFFLLLGLLVLVSFARRGVILIYLNDLILQYFSWVGIFLPFLFLSLSLLVSKFKTPLGQPNVVVGFLLFFFSLLSLSRGGLLGRIFWEGIASLVTQIGAFIILLGLTLIGLVVLFNTSLDQVLEFLKNLYLQVQWYIGKSRKNELASPKVEFKVGGMQPLVEKRQVVTEKKDVLETLEPKLVTNVPGSAEIWKYPPLSLLSNIPSGKAERGDIRGNADIIEETLGSFGIDAKVVEANLGPTVTQYALRVALGTKLSRITALERDLALALAAPTGTIRIEAPIPGKSLVGIELPNKTPEIVPLRKLLQSEEMEGKPKLAVALGLDVAGKPVIADIARMPHVLIAGQTGSGKSVCINAMLSTILFRASPYEVKFIMVDPKRVELTAYDGIPHLLSPVITEQEKIISALRWLRAEMERRYKLFAEVGARNIEAYNEMSGFQALPYIVLVIDELAEVILFSPVEVEDSITRIAQLSRATGIHMILATQRPSVNVITGLIKANIPCRIAFAVASQVDSRVILDAPGAEKLLGRGDMLYLPPEQAKPIRVQGSFITDEEIRNLVSFLRNQGVEPQYTEEVTKMSPEKSSENLVSESLDPLFEEAVRLVVQYEKASSSLLQRKLSVGYTRAARILDQLEAAGIVGPPQDSKPREVLIKSAEEFFSKLDSSSQGKE